MSEGTRIKGNHNPPKVDVRPELATAPISEFPSLTLIELSQVNVHIFDHNLNQLAVSSGMLGNVESQENFLNMSLEDLGNVAVRTVSFLEEKKVDKDQTEDIQSEAPHEGSSFGQLEGLYRSIAQVFNEQMPTVISVGADLSGTEGGAANAPIPEALLPVIHFTLGDMITNANNNPGPDFITLPAGIYTTESANSIGPTLGFSISGATSVDDLTITGAGIGQTIIDAQGVNRIFSIFTNGTVTLENLTIRNGDPGVDVGGAIYNWWTSTLVLNNVSIESSHAFHGGGIANFGTLIINDSTISGNTADDFGGGIYNSGSHIPSASVTINNSTISDNTAIAGGGVFDVLAKLTIDHSTISGNTVTTSNGTGGGVFMDQTIGKGSTISNSTIANNAVVGIDETDFGLGAGLVVGNSDLAIDSTIIYDNKIIIDTGIFAGTYEDFYNITIGAGNVTIDNSLYGPMSAGGSPTVTNSFIGPMTDGSIIDGGGNTPVSDPLLGPLANNGGPTQTHALGAGSPAINTGDPTDLSADQRGAPLVGVRDIGAFEFNGVVPPIILDLNHDGIHILSLAESKMFVDLNGDGVNDHQIAWAAPDDGVLIYDVNHNGIVDGLEEFNFVMYAPEAKTDMEALRLAFDTNHDGILDARDDKFADFGVWQDKNANGVTDPGEYLSLSDLGITAIHLNSDGKIQNLNGSVIYGTSIYEMQDGSTGTVADVGLAVTHMPVSPVQALPDLLIPAVDL